VRKKWLIVGLVVVTASASGTGLWLGRDRDDNRAGAVSAVTADVGEVTVDVASTGTVRAATTRSLSFGVAGTVEKVLVRAGSVVTAGTVLATIDAGDAADAVNDAEVALVDAQDRLADATSGTSAARTRATGQSAAGSATEAQSDASADGASADGSSTAGGSGDGEPVDSGSASGGSGDGGSGDGGSGDGDPGSGGPGDGGPAGGATDGRVTADGASGGGAGAEGVRAGQAGAANSAADVAALEGVAAQIGLDAIFTAQEQVNRATADLAAARAAFAGVRLTAPIAGTVMSVGGKVGSRVGAGATFITLADTYSMQVSASFPEADAGSIEVGQTATVTLADRVGQKFGAEIVQVDPVGSDEGALVTYGVILDFVRQPAELLVGQSAAVEVRTGEVASTLRVPTTALHDVDSGRGVVLVRGGRSGGRSGGAGDVRREVSVGLRGDVYTQITGGLNAGELVVRSW
jgi:HlyD family secretion protein